MDDFYASLIGEGANSQEKAALIANALRRRNQMGQLGMITGDKVLSQVGRGLSESSDDYAKQFQDIRQKDADNAQTREYQRGQLEHMDNVLKETIRNNNLMHEYHMAMAEAAGLRAENSGKTKIPKLRSNDIKDLENKAEIIGVIGDLRTHIQSGGGYGAKEFMGMPIPGSRPLANYAAAKGLGSEADKEAFRMKQNWDRLYTLGTRNALFGATLSNNEQKAWDAANPSAWQTNEQILKALTDLERAARERLNKRLAGLLEDGYDAEALAVFGDIPGVNIADNGEVGAPGGGSGGGAPQVAAPTGGAPKRIRVDAQGNIIQ